MTEHSVYSLTLIQSEYFMSPVSIPVKSGNTEIFTYLCQICVILGII